MYLEINVSVKSENVEEGEITFNVTKEWLINNDIDKNKVTLKRYVDKEWEALQTKITGENGKCVYYTAKTPGFSYYAITRGSGQKIEDIANMLDLCKLLA